MRLFYKTVSYGVLHVLVATSIAWLLTGNLAAAVGIGLIEPVAQTLVYLLHERVWEGRRLKEPEDYPVASYSQ
jgi:uncharacterized membrane protein